MKTPEDEEFEHLEQLNRLRGVLSAQRPHYSSAEAAFHGWSGRSHAPQQHSVQRAAFLAGWAAAREHIRGEQND